MNNYKALLTVLIIISTHVYSMGQIPTLKELAAQKIINKQDVTFERLPEYLITYLKSRNPEGTPQEIQQIFINAIIKKFPYQVNKLFKKTLTGHNRTVSSITVSHDNSLIATGSHDCTVKVWSSKTGQLLDTFPGHSSIASIAISANNAILISCFIDGITEVWSLITGQLLYTLNDQTDPIASAKISLDDKFIITRSYNGTKKVWDTQTGTLLYISDDQHIRLYNSGPIQSAEISPDDTYIATYAWGDSTVKIWDRMTGQLITTLDHTDKIRSINISSDSQYIITCSTDNTIKIWSSRNGQLIATCNGHGETVHSVAISSDNKFIVTGSDDTVTVWDIGYLTNTLTLADLLTHIKDKNSNNYITLCTLF